MKIPHGISAQKFIDFVNKTFMPNAFDNNEARRSRILLAEVLLRLEKIENILQKEK